MSSITNKNSFEKVIIFIGFIILVSILGFASFNLIGDRTKEKSDDINKSFLRVMDNDMYGIIRRNGEEVLPCKYNYICSFEEDLAIVVDEDGRYGYIGTDGTFVIPCRYDRAYNFKEGLGRVCMNDKYYYINSKGETVFKQGYDYIYGFSCERALIYQDGKFGYIDKKGELITPIVYDKAWDFVNGMAAVVIGRDLYLIDKEGRRKTYECYNGFVINEYMEGKGIIARKNGKWGYIDNAENILLDFKYDQIKWMDFGDVDWLLVELNGKYGAYDPDGHCLMEELDEDGIEYGWGANYPTICRKEGKYGLINIPDSFIYKYIERIDGPYYIATEGKTGDLLDGVIDRNGKTIIPFKYYSIEYQGEGIYKVEDKDGDYSLLNREGECISISAFDEVGEFREGLAPVRVDDKYGYIDGDGRLVIECQYEEADCFSEGIAVVKLNGKYGYIDKNGDSITGYRYDKAGDFYYGTAVVEIGGKQWLLGASGELLTKRPYSFICDDMNVYPPGNFKKYMEYIAEYEFFD